jgi:hypothetical protein
MEPLPLVALPRGAAVQRAAAQQAANSPLLQQGEGGRDAAPLDKMGRRRTSGAQGSPRRCEHERAAKPGARVKIQRSSGAGRRGPRTAASMSGRRSREPALNI